MISQRKALFDPFDLVHRLSAGECMPANSFFFVGMGRRNSHEPLRQSDQICLGPVRRKHDHRPVQPGTWNRNVQPSDRWICNPGEPTK